MSTLTAVRVGLLEDRDFSVTAHRGPSRWQKSAEQSLCTED